jgi:hypothetical protein
LRRERLLSLNGKSRVSREAQARFREGLGVQLPGATRPTTESRTRSQYVNAERLSCSREMTDAQVLSADEK